MENDLVLQSMHALKHTPEVEEDVNYKERIHDELNDQRRPVPVACVDLGLQSMTRAQQHTECQGQVSCESTSSSTAVSTTKHNMNPWGWSLSRAWETCTPAPAQQSFGDALSCTQLLMHLDVKRSARAHTNGKQRDQQEGQGAPTPRPKQMMTGDAKQIHSSSRRMNMSHLVRPSGLMRPKQMRYHLSQRVRGLWGGRQRTPVSLTCTSS
jgi:hypothetical protein